jgi:hypothetical protein
MGMDGAETSWKQSVDGGWVARQPPAPMGAMTAAGSAARAYTQHPSVEASGSNVGSGPANAASGTYFSA